MYIIAFEGIDGSGKSTLVRSVNNELTKNNQRVVTFAEPGDDEHGRVAREIIQGKQQGTAYDIARYMADSRRVTSKYIRKLRDSKTPPDYVLLDRSYFSSLVYNVLDIVSTKLHTIEEAEKFIEQYNYDIVPPDLYIFLDITPEKVSKRIVSKNKDKYESNSKFQEMVYARYKQIINETQYGALSIDADVEQNELVKTVTHLLLDTELIKFHSYNY